MNAKLEPVPLRRLMYPLLITLAMGAVAGKILDAQRVYEPALFRAEPADTEDHRSAWPPTRPEPEPTMGDNDRSRWDTVRALVDDGTYAIGYRDTDPGTGEYHDSGIITQDGWKTIDKVLQPVPHDGRQAFYSSKPPLLATLLAGEYWVLKRAFGLSIAGPDRWVVVRVILMTFNWLPLVFYLLLIAKLLERYGTTDWGRLYVLAGACLGTFLFPFSISLNNHVLAAYAVVFSLYPTMRIWEAYHGPDERTRPEVREWWFAVAGFFAAFAACMELPAASFAAAVLCLLLWLAPGRTLVFFVPAAAIPVAALFLTNYLAIGQLAPAYSEFGGPWYQFAGSYWQPPVAGEVKTGIDWAHEPKAVYAFHLLFGHHGFFSLTPIFLPALAGMVTLALWKRRGPGRPMPRGELSLRDTGLQGILLLTLLLTIVVVGFYVYKTNNYGGWTSAPRWLIWLTPLWLLSLAPAADWLALRRWGRGLAYLLLALSVLSVHYPAWNPWRHPWLYNLMVNLGWIRY